MRFTPVALALILTGLSFGRASFAHAKEAPLSPTIKDDVRVLGHLNVNQATRDELLQIPGLDTAKADELLSARAHGALSSLASFNLSPEALARLSVEGSSTLRRIRVLPLETFAPAATSAAR